MNKLFSHRILNFKDRVLRRVQSGILRKGANELRGHERAQIRKPLNKNHKINIQNIENAEKVELCVDWARTRYESATSISGTHSIVDENDI